MDRFSYTVTHDLKAPLRAINNLSKWIEEDLGENTSDEVRGNMKMLRARVKRMENFINGILNYSKAGKFFHEIEMVNLRELLNEITDMLAPPKEFTIDIQNDIPTIAIEKIALEQVFQNLLSNAMKFHNNPKGNIIVTYKDKGDFYEFIVEDDGPGIDKVFQEKIFVIFQTLHTQDRIETAGAGLAIAKKNCQTLGLRYLGGIGFRRRNKIPFHLTQKFFTS